LPNQKFQVNWKKLPANIKEQKRNWCRKIKSYYTAVTAAIDGQV
jgi:hypothetical protein